MTLHIVVAEDDTIVLHFLGRAIQRIKPKATISSVDNGLDALTIMQSQGCDLIISDNQMPSMSGLDLLSAIRHTSAVPFIMLSADKTTKLQAVAAGVTLFLAKPIDFATLRDAVLHCLP